MDTSHKDLNLLVYNTIKYEDKYDYYQKLLENRKKELALKRKIEEEKKKKNVKRILVTFLIISTLLINNAKGLEISSEENIFNCEKDEIEVFDDTITQEEKVLLNTNIDIENSTETAINTIDSESDLVEEVIQTETNETSNSYVEQSIIENSIEVDEKLSWILDNYNLTYDQFLLLNAIVNAESKANSYTDAYAVINTLYNRTISETWVNYIDSIMGEGCGKNLYYQAICPGQFEVYLSGRYLSFINDTYADNDQAVIDMLYSLDLMHNYLSFKSSNTYVSDSEQFVENGNNYHEVLYDYDRISDYSR